METSSSSQPRMSTRLRTKLKSTSLTKRRGLRPRKEVKIPPLDNSSSDIKTNHGRHGNDSIKTSTRNYSSRIPILKKSETRSSSTTKSKDHRKPKNSTTSAFPKNPKNNRFSKNYTEQNTNKVDVDPSSSTTTTKASNIKVIVLGAGIAGLGCAKELIKRNYNVLVLEGRKRPGGRLKSIPLRLGHDYNGLNSNSDSNHLSSSLLSVEKSKRKKRKLHELNQRYDLSFTPPPPPSSSSSSSLHTTAQNNSIVQSKPTVCPVDMGGAFIHGANNNPISTLCHQMGISTKSTSVVCPLLEYSNNGWPVCSKLDTKVHKRFDDILERSLKLGKEIMEREDSLLTSVDNNVKHLQQEQQDKNSLNYDNHTTTSNSNDSINSQQRIPLEQFDKSVSFGEIFRFITQLDSKVKKSEDKNSNSNVPDHDHTSSSYDGGYPPNSIEAALFRWHVLNLEMSCGTKLDNLGLAWNEDEQFRFDGDHVLLREGFGCLIEGLAEGVDIKYDMEVTGIRIVTAESDLEHDQNNSDCNDNIRQSLRRSTRMSSRNYSNNTKQCDENDGNHCQEMLSPTKVQVRTASGLTFEAHHVVCTFPLGVLAIPRNKPGHIQFYPPLPENKQQAISKLGFGHYNKCALSFPYIFWSSADDFIGVVNSPVAGTSVLFCNVSVVHGLPILVLIYGGQFAKDMEALTDEVIVKECMDVLRRVYGKVNVVPDPVDYTVSRWGLDRFARGAFSYVPKGIDGLKEYFVMSEPIYDPAQIIKDEKRKKQTSHTITRCMYEDKDVGDIPHWDPPRRPVILFGGEATNPYHPSTIHGAFESGIREAYRLDLAVEPEANKYMKFDDRYLYKKTFNIQKRFFTAQQSTKIMDNNEPQKKLSFTGRRRGLGDNININKRKGNIDNPEPDRTSIRKSKRQISQVSINSTIFTDDVQPKNQPPTNQETAYSIAEDLALLRGVDCYGHDQTGMKIIQSLMLPTPQVNGDANNISKTIISQSKGSRSLISRYVKLVKERADAPSIDSNTNNSLDIDQSWFAAKESESWWEGIQNKAKKSDNEPNILVNVRKSCRPRKKKVW